MKGIEAYIEAFVAYFRVIYQIQLSLLVVFALPPVVFFCGFPLFSSSVPHILREPVCKAGKILSQLISLICSLVCIFPFSVVCCLNMRSYPGAPE